MTAVLALPVPPAVIFGAGLGTYMLGASVLIVLGARAAAAGRGCSRGARRRRVPAAGQAAALTHPAWAALAATPLLALALAPGGPGRTSPGRGRHAATGSGPPHSGPHTRRQAGWLVTGTELRGALPSAGFGLVAAGLFAFPVAAGMPGHAGAPALLVSLPLAMSMGAAEWMLIWFRRRTQRLLRSTREPRAFATGSRLTLLAALLLYLAVTAALTAAVTAVAVGTRLAHPDLGVLPQVAAYLAVGGAMFTALLLQAFGSRICSAGRLRGGAGRRGRMPRRRSGRPVGGLHAAAHRARRVRGPGAEQRDTARLLSPAGPRAAPAGHLLSGGKEAP